MFLSLFPAWAKMKRNLICFCFLRCAPIKRNSAPEERTVWLAYHAISRQQLRLHYPRSFAFACLNSSSLSKPAVLHCTNFSSSRKSAAPRTTGSASSPPRSRLWPTCSKCVSSSFRKRRGRWGGAMSGSGLAQCSLATLHLFR